MLLAVNNRDKMSHSVLHENSYSDLCLTSYNYCKRTPPSLFCSQSSVIISQITYNRYKIQKT